MRTKLVACACALVACGGRQPPPMQLRRVTLYQNGIGYFERAGHYAHRRLALRFARPELDDVLKTLTVIDRLGGAVATVDVPKASERARTVELGVRLGAARAHDLLVGYAVPTPAWKAAYRIVLGQPETVLQGWALVSNTSQEDWRDVTLTLATGAPMSFATGLATPEYVKRPDASGHLVAPTVLGPVDGERAVAQDRDADGIVDVDDKCPDEAEADGDGGCPERGRVIETSGQIYVLKAIQFARGEAVLSADALEIVDEAARTLKEVTDIRRLEIQGHASGDEAEPWLVSSRRAAAVRAALMSRGVAAERLAIAPYGATRSIGRAEIDRRVEFVIVSRGEDAAVPAALPAVQVRTRPQTVAGAVRYELAAPITIPRGASTLVPILDKQVEGEDAFLFRPDGNAPGSDRHPFRAARIVNTTGYTLEPGPVAIFGHGTFVGDTLLRRIEVGETAWIPYALDGGTTITVTTSDEEHPARLISIHRGVLTVEDAGTRTTRYAVAAGRQAASKLYIRHTKAAGFTTHDLPPGSVDQGDAYLVSLPLTAGQPATLAIDEREPRRRTIALVDGKPAELAAYIANAPVPIAAKLRDAIAARKDLSAAEEALGSARERLADLATRAEELRRTLAAIDKVTAPALRKQLLSDLTQLTSDSTVIARELATHSQAVSAARIRLADAIRDLTLDEIAGAP